jgi:hypothetical protein
MRVTLVLLFLGLVAPYSAQAEKADTSAEAMREGATNVLVGTVKAVYTRTTRDGD